MNKKNCYRVLEEISIKKIQNYSLKKSHIGIYITHSLYIYIYTIKCYEYYSWINLKPSWKYSVFYINL